MKKKWDFYNFPVFYPLEEYGKAKKKYVDKVLQYPCVKSVYELGSVSVPGISDIDFIFVIDPSKLSDNNLPHFLDLHTKLGKDVNYLVCHEPMGILTADLFVDIYWLLPTNGIKFLAGEKMNLNTPSPEDFKELELRVLMDYLLRYWPWEFMRVKKIKKVDVRMILLRLNSFKHSINIYRNIVKDEKFGYEFISVLEQLRAEWFANDINENLDKVKDLITDSIDLGWDMIEGLSSFLKIMNVMEFNSMQAEFENIRRYYFFSEKWGRATARRLFEFGIHFLPFAFFMNLMYCSQQQGLLSKRIKSNLYVNNKIEIPDVSKSLLKRIDLMNKHLEFVFSNRWLCGLFNSNKFGMFAEGRLHHKRKRYLDLLKTFFCCCIRKPFFCYKNRRNFQKITTDKKYNILYVNHTTQIGGGTNSQLSLITSLNKNKFYPIMVIPDKEGPLIEKLEEHKIYAEVLPLHRLRKKNPFLYLYTVLKLIVLIKKKKIDLIHSNIRFSNQYLVLAAKLTRTPIITHVRGVLKREWFFEFFFWLSTFFIANSYATEKSYLSLMKKSQKSIVIHNAVNLDWFIPGIYKGELRKQFNIKDDVFLIGIVGRLIEEKGHLWFLEAFNKLTDVYPNVCVVIAGDTSIDSSEYYLKQLKQQVDKFNLKDKVVFTGFIKDTAKIYDSLDLLVLPSEEEAFGRVVIEAMAMNVPVIATDAGGVVEIVVEGKTGSFVPYKDIDSLKDVMLEMVNNRDIAKKMGCAGRKRVEEFFSLDLNIEKIQDVYWKVLHNV